MNSWSDRNAVLDRERSGREIAALWDADPCSVRLVNDRINIVYRFEVGGRGMFLKVCAAANRSMLEQRAAAEYLQHLASNGADVCAPVLSRDGRRIEEYRLGDDVFLAWVTDEAPGRVISLEEPTVAEFRAWGVALGKMHNAAESYRPSDDLSYFTWKDLWQQTHDGMDRDDSEPVWDEYDQLTPWLESLSEDPDVYGLTHTDIRTENAMWDGERVRIIDFDEPVYHWYASDVMRPFLEVAQLPAERFDPIFDAFLAGYREVRTFTDRWVEELPRLARMKNLGFYWWINVNSSKEGDWYVEWLEGIRVRFGAPRLRLGPRDESG
jgi:Ser/Thr protein kinase RdoA (MazF antagonist)